MRQQAKLARSSEDKERVMSEKFNLTIGGGGIMRHRCDFGAQCRYAWDRIGVFWKSTARRSRISTKSSPACRTFAMSPQRAMPNRGVRKRDPSSQRHCCRVCPRLAALGGTSRPRALDRRNVP
jgi:hypothetical protein